MAVTRKEYTEKRAAASRLPSGVYEGMINSVVSKSLEPLRSKDTDEVWKHVVAVGFRPVERVADIKARETKEGNDAFPDNNEEAFEAWQAVNGNSNTVVEVDIRMSNNTDYSTDEMQIYAGPDGDDVDIRNMNISIMENEAGRSLIAFDAEQEGETLEDAVINFANRDDPDDKMITVIVRNYKSDKGSVNSSFSFNTVS